MKKYLYMSTTYLILGLISGVFYREFTKFSGFEGQTVLKGVHSHLLVLGFFVGLLLLILCKTFDFHRLKGAKAWFVTYNVSLIYMAGTLLARGILEVKSLDFAGLSHIAGLAHAMLGISLIWFVVLCFKMIPREA